MTEASATDLAAEARPLTGTSASSGQLPLPPAELVDQLDNSAPAKDEDEPEVATLDFVGDDLPFREFKLRHPFRLGSRTVETVRVNQLTTAQVGKIAGEWNRAKKAPDYYDIYAAMTDLPAPVLRALPHIDGELILNQAFDFLPPSFRPADG